MEQSACETGKKLDSIVAKLDEMSQGNTMIRRLSKDTKWPVHDAQDFLKLRNLPVKQLRQVIKTSIS